MKGAQPINMTPRQVERFKDRAPIDTGTTDCVEWTGQLDKEGYGAVSYWDSQTGKSVKRKAHRVSYWIHYGFIDEREIDHLCRNRACVNPLHLELVTAGINTARGQSAVSAAAAAFLLGYCLRGHRLAEVGLHKSGKSRCCAECGRQRVAKYLARKAGVSR